MTKVDYTKTEMSLTDAVRSLNTQKLLQGIPITSPNTEAFFRHSSSRPVQQEAIERLVSEMAAIEEIPSSLPEDSADPAQQDEQNQDEPDHFLPITSTIPLEESCSTAPSFSKRAPIKQPIAMDTLLSPERYISATDALLILRNHILWLKRQGIENRYERIGSSEQEVMEFRASTRLSPTQRKRILELNKNAEQVKQELLHIQSSDQELIDQAKKNRPQTKNLSIKKDWLPL